MLCCPSATLQSRSPSRCAWGAQHCRAVQAGTAQDEDSCHPRTDRGIYSPGATGWDFLCACLVSRGSQLHPCTLHGKDSLFINLRNKGCVLVPLTLGWGAGAGAGGPWASGGAKPGQSLMLWAKPAQPQAWGQHELTPAPAPAHDPPCPASWPLGRRCGPLRGAHQLLCRPGNPGACSKGADCPCLSFPW